MKRSLSKTKVPKQKEKQMNADLENISSPRIEFKP